MHHKIAMRILCENTPRVLRGGVSSRLYAARDPNRTEMCGAWRAKSESGVRESSSTPLRSLSPSLSLWSVPIRVRLVTQELKKKKQ